MVDGSGGLALETAEQKIEHGTHVAKKKSWRNNITLQVFIAIVAAIILGELDPKLALEMRPLGDLFIKLIRMAIAPIVFLCVSTGVARIGDVRKVRANRPQSVDLF